MPTNYQIAFEALRGCRPDRSFNLSKPEQWRAMLAEKRAALAKAGIEMTDKQFLRAIIGPRDGYWTMLDQAQYIAERAKFNGTAKA